MSEVTEFLQESDFQRHPIARFRDIGDKVSGVVVEEPRVVEVDDMDDPGGPKIKKLVVPVETGEPYQSDDPEEADLQGDTVRTLWINRGRMAAAVSQALKKADASGIVQNSQLAVQYTGDGVQTRKGWNAPKQYAAQYKPPAESGINPDDLL